MKKLLLAGSMITAISINAMDPMLELKKKIAETHVTHYRLKLLELGQQQGNDAIIGEISLKLMNCSYNLSDTTKNQLKAAGIVDQEGAFIDALSLAEAIRVNQALLLDQGYAGANSGYRNNAIVAVYKDAFERVSKKVGDKNFAVLLLARAQNPNSPALPQDIANALKEEGILQEGGLPLDPFAIYYGLQQWVNAKK